MSDLLLTAGRAKATPLHVIAGDDWDDWRAAQPDRVIAWLDAVRFGPEAGRWAQVPDEAGSVAFVAVGAGARADLWTLAELPAVLPAGRYGVAATYDRATATDLALGWAMGAYVFDRYKKGRPAAARPQLVWPKRSDKKRVTALAEAIHLGRDMINTPAEDMNPGALERLAYAIGDTHGAKVKSTVGSQLLRKKFPMVHAVGRAAAADPRLIDLKWGNPRHPKVTVVGKGVCFDSGGLDLKPSSAMRLMKKDMGGAATALALGQAIMAAELPIRLRIVLPAVENAVGAGAFRPGDILNSRKGLTVEVGNTDAEGRLVLADALTLAAEETPALLIDLATLTGAARVALGPELPALFCNDEGLAADLAADAARVDDPLWRLPLWQPYAARLDSKVADLCNISDGPFGGAVTAALFLERFVEPGIPWAHLDTFAWNDRPRPGRPAGGEVLGLRAVFSMLTRRFGA